MRVSGSIKGPGASTYFWLVALSPSFIPGDGARMSCCPRSLSLTPYSVLLSFGSLNQSGLALRIADIMTLAFMGSRFGSGRSWRFWHGMETYYGVLQPPLPTFNEMNC